MGRFLRDEAVKNFTIDEESLIRISDEMIARANIINEGLDDSEESKTKRQIVTYVIRFDNKGHRFYNINEVLRYYRDANKVERIIMTMDSLDSLRSSRLSGTHVEIRLDSNQPNNCNMVVSSDNSDWVESSYSTFSELLNKMTNKHGVIRTPWTPFIVQISGVIAGFIVSLWAALKISPHLAIESAFVVSFLFTFLVFSNIWTYLNQQIIVLIDYCFPNMQFVRKDKEKLHWLIQALVGGVVVAVTLYLINLLFGYVGSVLGQFIAKKE